MSDLYTPSKIYRTKAKEQLCSMAALEAGSELSSGINKESYSPKLEPFKIINETLDCQHCRSDHHQFCFAEVVTAEEKKLVELFVTSLVPNCTGCKMENGLYDKQH